MNIRILYLLICIGIIIPAASAYLDPGVGSMVWQMIVAVGFGIAFTLKFYWIKIKKFFNGERNDLDDDQGLPK